MVFFILSRHTLFYNTQRPQANSRAGLLFAKLDLQRMPLEVLKRVFACYILPVFDYDLVLWISGKFSSASEDLVNSSFTKYWKRYLNLPLHTHNAMVYYLTNTMPLMSNKANREWEQYAYLNA